MAEQRGKDLKWTPGHTGREMASVVSELRGVTAMVKNLDAEYVEEAQLEALDALSMARVYVESAARILIAAHDDQKAKRLAEQKRVEG